MSLSSLIALDSRRSIMTVTAQVSCRTLSNFQRKHCLNLLSKLGFLPLLFFVAALLPTIVQQVLNTTLVSPSRSDGSPRPRCHQRRCGSRGCRTPQRAHASQVVGLRVRQVCCLGWRSCWALFCLAKSSSEPAIT